MNREKKEDYLPNARLDSRLDINIARIAHLDLESTLETMERGETRRTESFIK